MRRKFPNGYYVYAYLRDDHTPYYIGQGIRSRAWKKAAKHRIPIPKDDKIVIMERGLTQIGAVALERRYIRWYGRIDLGTGILINQTDGGFGRDGAEFSEETKCKMSIAKKGKPNPNIMGAKNGMAGRTGNLNHMWGKRRLDLTEYNKKRRGTKFKKIRCDVCGVEITAGRHLRHFDKCKEKANGNWV